jgi:putative SOS response-associated peptidase YedK
MCGVFGYTTRDLDERYGSRWHVEKYMSWEPRYNIRPTQNSPVIVNKNSKNIMELMRFGLIPSWSKYVKLDYPTINARVETVAKLPTYAKPFRTQRVCVLTNGFFEWMPTKEKKKQPFFFHFKDNRPFCLAGIYDVNNIASDTEIKSYSIITQPAGSLVGPIHARQPTVLADESVKYWLNPDNNDPEKLISMLKPFQDKEMEAYPVSLLVNNVVNDSKEILKPMKVI